jgi:subtilisin family serine protease
MLTGKARRALAAGALWALAAGIAAPIGGAAAPGAGAASPLPAYVPNEILVSYRPGTDARQAGRLAALLRVVQAQGVGRSGLQRLRMAPGASVEGAVARLRREPAVAYAEPNYLYTVDRTPDDPLFTDGQLWGLNNPNDADIDAPEAWDLATGSASVAVAVVDTGVDDTHPDLAANILRNGDGSVVGYDFANGDPNPMDDHGHGTHVAGTIGGRANNATGVAGVCWDVSIVPLKFMGRDGSGSTAAAVDCLDYACALKRERGINIVATNNSWGGPGASQSLQDAIARCSALGILCVAAAGNDGTNNDSRPFYPAGYADPGVLAVAATDAADRRASFSNYGAATVDLGAPGVGIWSSIPGGRYASYSGTSMAAPHVTGAAALLAAYDPSLTSPAIKARLMATGDPVAALADKTVSGRRLNAYNALAGSGGGSVVPAALQVALAIGKPTFRIGELVAVRVHVAGGGSPVGGASVGLELRTSKDRLRSGTVTTDAAGDALFSYRARRGDGKGTWSVSATANKSGFTTGTASITFTVR